MEWKLNSSLLTAGQMRRRCTHLLLKYSLIFVHTDKSNTFFKSIKTLHLFVCTHNNNKMLRFCKIMKANRMRFLPSVNLSTSLRNSVYTYLPLQTLNIYIYIYIYIYIVSEMSTSKLNNSNRKQIFSDNVIRMKHT